MSWRELMPTAPDSALDLLSKLLTYDPDERLTATEVLQHEFFEDLFQPEEDEAVIEGGDVSYYDFEFEQYSLNKSILRELILDEIIMSNSKEARKENRRMRTEFPNGVLENIYVRSEPEGKKKNPTPAPAPAPPRLQASKALKIVTSKAADTEAIKEGKEDSDGLPFGDVKTPDTAAESPIKNRLGGLKLLGEDDDFAESCGKRERRIFKRFSSQNITQELDSFKYMKVRSTDVDGPSDFGQ